MRRNLFFLFILLISLAALLVMAWAWSQPGGVSVNFGTGTVVEVNLAIAGVLLLVFGGLVTFLIWSIGFVISLPKKLEIQRSRGRAERSSDAITQGILAIEGGDIQTAQRFARIGSKYAENERLRLLLEARVAEATGEWRVAEKNWELLTLLSGGQIVGLRGAANAADKRGDAVEAKNRLKSALKLKSQTKWPFDLLFDTQVKDGLWTEALETLEVGEKRGYVTAEVASRQRAVLMTAQGTGAGQDKQASLKLLQEASKICPAFPVASWHGAKLSSEDGKRKEAERLILEAWKSRPHPALSILYGKIETKKSSEGKISRVDALVATNPEHRESRIVLAEKAIDQEKWEDAITILKEIADEKKTTRVCLLLAKAYTGSQVSEEATRWITTAATAAREADWSDLDAEGVAFAYDKEDWSRLVYAFGENAELIHPRYERYSQELDVGTVKVAEPKVDEVERQGFGGLPQVSKVSEPQVEKVEPPKAAEVVKETKVTKELEKEEEKVIPPVDYPIEEKVAV